MGSGTHPIQVCLAMAVTGTDIIIDHIFKTIMGQNQTVYNRHGVMTLTS